MGLRVSISVQHHCYWYWQPILLARSPQECPTKHGKKTQHANPTLCKSTFTRFMGNDSLKRISLTCPFTNLVPSQKTKKTVRTFIQLDSIFHFVRWVTVVPYFRCFAENLDGGDVLEKNVLLLMGFEFPPRNGWTCAVYKWLKPMNLVVEKSSCARRL